MLDLSSKAYSTDTVEIINIQNASFVKKTFFSNFPRALKNIKKQQDFTTLSTGALSICSAEIYDIKTFNDKIEVLMPYVEGMNAESFLVHLSTKTLQTFSSALSTFIYSELSQSEERDIKTSIFLDKLENIKGKVFDHDIRTKLEVIANYILNLPKALSFPMGRCHGDLTLSNMIFDVSKGIVLLDFLDTYLETPLQDVVKLDQDFTYLWSFRYNSDSNILKSSIMCRWGRPKVIDHMVRYYPIQTRVLMLMTLARIAPYIRDDVTKLWLLNSLTLCIKNYAL